MIEITEINQIVTIEVSDLGIQGEKGDSAYQVAVDNGFVGTEAQWLEFIRGADEWGEIGGVLSNQTDLQNALDNKVDLTDPRLTDSRTPLAHTHLISEVTNLQTELDSKAESVHTHIISDVTNLQNELDNKSNLGHTHTKSEITDFAHAHLISDITGLQGALDFKSNITHTHNFSEINNKPTTLTGYGITDATPSSHIGSGGTSHSNATVAASGFMSNSDKQKLDGVQAGSTANASDSFLINRANHTGTQLSSTISDFSTAVAATAIVKTTTPAPISNLWRGTLAQYNAIVTKDPATLYFID